MLVSDNGAAGEGGPRGSWNELIPFNGLTEADGKALEGDHTLGTPRRIRLSPRLGAGGQHPAQVVQAPHIRRRCPRAVDRELAGGRR